MLARIHHHYEHWEETRAGMWRRPNGMERDEHVNRCSGFMANTEQFRTAMYRVIVEWRVSCEQNLTCMDLNRQAWLGHAACCLAIGCPEEPTRAAWWTLTQEQRDAADAAAAEVIEEWEKQHMERTRCQSDQLGLTF